jgi:hypothetical protein
MFKLTETPVYWWPVELLTVDAEGQIGSATVDVQFRRLTVDEETALMADTREHALSDLDVSRRILTGLRRVVDEHGVEPPWSDALRDAFLAKPGVASAVVAAFFLSRNQAALGNLKRSRADGPAVTTPPSATATSARP